VLLLVEVGFDARAGPAASRQGGHLVPGSNRLGEPPRIDRVLLGRNRERAALDALLTEAREGRSGVLAILGEAGIGKTALLEYARSRAEGMHVLHARGIESEAHVPFAGLLELLRPALAMLAAIPQPQADALGGALALRPPTAQARFAVGAATLSLLAAYAEDGPVLVLVDDAHWLDGSSAEAVLFAVRRLLADPIAVVLAARDDEPSLLAGADLPLLRIEGLDKQSAAELLGREAAGVISPDAAERLYRSTAGNPLALLELAPDAAQIAATPWNTPVPVSTSIARAFLRRSATLPDTARRLLVVAAANDGGELDVLSHAATQLGLDVEELGAAEQAGLVRIDADRVEFRHPLARSAVYGNADPTERRRAHRALADALPDRDIDRRAWHLSSASVGPDDDASSALEQAGARARARSAYAVAAAAYERSGRLAATHERRAELLYAAADAAWLAGDGGRAVALLEEARDLSTDSRFTLRIDHLRAHVSMRSEPVMRSYELLTAGAMSVADDDPALAVAMLAEAADACFYAGDARRLAETAERAAAIDAGTDDRAAFFTAILQGMAGILAGHAEGNAAFLHRAVEIFEASDELQRDPLLLGWAAMPHLWLREADAGRVLIDRAIAAARTRTALGMLPRLLLHIALYEASTGRTAAAAADFHEAVRHARETGQRSELAGSLAGLARIDARLGKADECIAHATEARTICRELGIGTHDLWALAALGELELARGETLAAVTHFEEQQAVLERLGVADVDLWPAPDLVEAYLRLGRREDALAILEPYERGARTKDRPWALARLHRSLGLLAEASEFAACFEEALSLHEPTNDLFEIGRTRLAYGARLRRSRKRVRARAELHAAIELFDQIGAGPWAEQASAELAATGETARRRDASTLDALTPQELQIGLLLAEGRTTREAAATLFLSPKTVEYHLRHIYRKLDVNSRDALSSALAARDSA
jgi:DNA-binding CsgD family transcriptional regulator